MNLSVVVDVASAVPPYEQIRAQIAALVAAGALPPGSRLPSVRALARDLGIAANTAARAYRELEASGVVLTGSRSGTVVAAGADTHTQLDPALHDALDALIRAARGAGLDDRAIVELVYGALLTSGPELGR